MTQRKLDTIKRHTIRRHAELLTMSELDRQRLYYELISQRFRHLGEQRSRELFLEETDATKINTIPDPFNSSGSDPRVPAASQPKLGAILRSCCPPRGRSALGTARPGVRKLRMTIQNQPESIPFRSVMGLGRGEKRFASTLSSRSEDLDSIVRQTRKLRDNLQQKQQTSDIRLHSPMFPHSNGSGNVPGALVNEAARAFSHMKSTILPAGIKPDAIELFNRMVNTRHLPPLGAAACSEAEQKSFEQLISGTNCQTDDGCPPNLAAMTNYLMNLQNNSCSQVSGC